MLLQYALQSLMAYSLHCLRFQSTLKTAHARNRKYTYLATSYQPCTYLPFSVGRNRFALLSIAVAITSILFRCAVYIYTARQIPYNRRAITGKP